MRQIAATGRRDTEVATTNRLECPGRGGGGAVYLIHVWV